MKLFVVIILFIGVIGTVIANIAPTPPSHCDFKCTQLDLLTCATNGKCFLQFTGKCALQKYNCRNPQRTFSQVDEFKCSVHSAPRCQTGDY